MQKEFIDQWTTLGKNALESMKELGEINAKLIAKITEQQQAILNTCLEVSSKEMQLLSEVKDPKELLAKQSALAAQYNTKFVEIMRTTHELLAECKNELTSWAEKGMEQAVAPFTKKPL